MIGEVDMECSLFKILVSEDDSKLEQFLLTEGKSPKVICHIQFMDLKKKETVEEKKENRG